MNGDCTGTLCIVVLPDVVARHKTRQQPSNQIDRIITTWPKERRGTVSHSIGGHTMTNHLPVPEYSEMACRTCVCAQHLINFTFSWLHSVCVCVCVVRQCTRMHILPEKSSAL